MTTMDVVLRGLQVVGVVTLVVWPVWLVVQMRYRRAARAYLEGVQKAQEAGHDVALVQLGASVKAAAEKAGRKDAERYATEVSGIMDDLSEAVGSLCSSRPVEGEASVRKALSRIKVLTGQ